MINHRDLKSLLGAYVVNAVDADERRAVRQHLETCDSCREEVSDHLESLATLADEEQAPDSVWQGIVGTLQENSPPEASSVLPPRPSARWIPTRMGLVLGAAALILFTFMGIRLVDQERKIDSIESAMQRQSLSSLAQLAAEDPDAMLLTMQSTDKSKLARLVVLPDGRGYVLSNNLDALPQDQTYQLWALMGDKRISLGVLGTDPGVSAFRAVGGASGFAITIEKAGGAPSPEGSPVVFGFSDKA